jgi:hypothetical protein
MQENDASRDKEKDAWENEHKEVAHLTKNMNTATTKLNLSLLDRDRDMEDDKEV